MIALVASESVGVTIRGEDQWIISPVEDFWGEETFAHKLIKGNLIGGTSEVVVSV